MNSLLLKMCAGIILLEDFNIPFRATGDRVKSWPNDIQSFRLKILIQMPTANSTCLLITLLPTLQYFTNLVVSLESYLTRKR